jgi:hypothetical protein
MNKLIIGIMLLSTSVFGTIKGIKEERVVAEFKESIGGFPLKIDNHLTQIDMFVNRTKEKKVEIVNVYIFQSNSVFDQVKLFGRYKEAMIETYCEDDMLFGDDKKITIIHKYVHRGEFIKTLRLNASECK